ncbi:tocopherol cyclase family protein [Clostridium sp.]|uniref:tocopherol cyclase family protein n=1 Tax=Clostridium sp. TaxID=1506 RepID=UPI003F358970
MSNFHGNNKRKSFFEGWYFKHQNETDTLAFIPGINIDDKGNKEAFIQVITNTKSYNVKYPYSDFSIDQNLLEVKIADNKFSKKGINIDIQNSDLKIAGHINYSDLTPIKYDIMGPFSIIPFMECNHGVISLKHNLIGTIVINNEEYKFNNGIGYIEKDWGTSFPKSYLWTQCNSFKNKEDSSIMVSIADIPFMGMNFQGCIAIVFYKGEEYRLATYNGVKIINCSENKVEIKRGKYKLEVDLITKEPQKLFAPTNGNMNRVIHENAVSHASYKFYIKNNLILDVESDLSSFEYVNFFNQI